MLNVKRVSATAEPVSILAIAKATVNALKDKFAWTAFAESTLVAKIILASAEPPALQDSFALLPIRERNVWAMWDNPVRQRHPSNVPAAIVLLAHAKSDPNAPRILIARRVKFA